MKFSIASSAVSLISKDTEEEIKNFAQAKIKHVDFGFASGFFHPEHRPCDDNTFYNLTEKAVICAKEAGIDFPMAHAPYVFNSNESREAFDEQVKDVIRVIKRCEFMGIDRLTVHGGYGFCQNREEFYQKNVAYFSALLPTAEKYGITLMIENISEKIYKREFVIETAEDILEIKRRLGNHPLIRACWDTGHANLCQLDQYANISTLGENLSGVHLHDNFGYNDDHMTPLAGNVNFDEVIKAITDIGYSGAFNFETKGFRSGDEWPNYRRKYTKNSNAERKLWAPERELTFEGLHTMRFVGEYIMNKYGIPIE